MNEERPDFQGLGVAGALRLLTQTLASHGIEGADVDARLLLFAAAGLDRAALIRDPEAKLLPEAAERLTDFAQRRLAGEPPTRIVGRRAFWTLDLAVAPDVLDPRPDTETIVEAALDALGSRRTGPLRILDLGVGSGALLLALLAECPRATGLGVDLSPDACALARGNAERNGLSPRAEIRQGRWMNDLAETFDLIVSNPPYIETEVIAGLSTEVRAHDPALALDGGPDGLVAYREIIAALPSRLRPDGVVVFELGAGQAPAVSRIAQAAGFSVAGLRRDLGGVDRALVLKRVFAAD